MRKRRRNHVLVVVDLQRALEVPPRMVGRIERYSRRFTRRVFTRFVNPRGSPFRRELHQRCCLPGTSDTELILPPGADDLVFTKRGYGLSAAQIARLRKHGVTRATICGVDTDACVLGVMFSLFDAGIPCHAKPELCWSSNGLQSAAIRIMRKQFPPHA